MIIPLLIGDFYFLLVLLEIAYGIDHEAIVDFCHLQWLFREQIDRNRG